MLNFNISISWDIVMIIVWLAVIAIGVIVETQTAELVSIWFAISGAVAIVCAIAGLDIAVQVAIFTLLTLILVLATRPFVKKLTRNTKVSTNADRFIGMVGTITKTIEEDDRGIVKVEYQEWTAVSASNKSIPAGTKVIVKEIIGNKFVVDCIEEIEIK